MKDEGMEVSVTMNITAFKQLQGNIMTGVNSELELLQAYTYPGSASVLDKHIERLTKGHPNSVINYDKLLYVMTLIKTFLTRRTPAVNNVLLKVYIDRMYEDGGSTFIAVKYIFE